MGLTLIEAMKHETRVERLAVIKTFSEGQLISRLPFRNLLGGALKFAVEKKMPRVGFRAVNEGYRRDYGAVADDTEFVHLFGGDLDVDRSIVDLNGPEARASQTEQKVRSMRMTLEAAIINGDANFDPRAFNGLSKRLPPGAKQTVDNGGTTVSLTRLETMVDGVRAHGSDRFLLTSRAGRRQISTACRSTGDASLYQVIDGRHWFEDTEILVLDEDANGNEVLGFTEAGNTTSIYCCSFGDELMTGLQGPFEGRYGISVRDFGEVQDAPVFRTRVDWYVGFAVCDSSCIGRLYDIGPAVA
ncbi:hypothetical protein KBY78_11565 [Synechococcus sp. EJ6-Ellesmere]|nr:hypothetical protein [Synechococcus sp. EJ6-Ellesmere]